LKGSAAYVGNWQKNCDRKSCKQQQTSPPTGRLKRLKTNIFESAKDQPLQHPSSASYWPSLRNMTKMVTDSIKMPTTLIPMENDKGRAISDPAFTFINPRKLEW